jgi:hypothetical protein
MVEIASIESEFNNGTPVTVVISIPITEKTVNGKVVVGEDGEAILETGEEVILKLTHDKGNAIVIVPRKPFALAGIGLYKVGDVEDKSDQL